MKAAIYALTVVVVLAVIVVASVAAPGRARTQAQDGGLPAPANVRVADGANAGAAVVSWDAVDGAPFYRIGWVAMDDVAAARAEGWDWLEAFVFSDVANRGRTAHTVRRLTPCIRYAFIAASLNRRFGDASWSEWAFLTPGAGNDSCPAAVGTPTPVVPAPTPTPTPTSTLTPTPWPTPAGAGDYDADKDGLIEVSNLAQLAAIRADLDGDGAAPAPAYAAAFPNAMPGMGCPDPGCTGYELAADLDFDTNGNRAADAGDAYWNGGAGWVPIGDSGRKFTADFDGNNHTIANLYINRGGDFYIGLFGYASGSSIKQVGIVSAVVSGSSAGGLVGVSDGGAISGSYATGSVSGGYSAGGLVGVHYDGAISDSYAISSVSGDAWVGGLVGISNGAISDSYAKGSVSSDSFVGGLVGSSGGAISGSYATGGVSGGDDVGGLVGVSNGTISGSYATGSVFGGEYVGGLVGSSSGAVSGSYATGGVSSQGNYAGGLVGSSGGAVRGSYAAGKVSGSGSVGGLVGESNDVTISASYAIGDVSGGGDDIGGLVGRMAGGAVTASYAAGRVAATGVAFYIGGLVGYGEGGNIAASYWDTHASGQAVSYGGVGKTTVELQSPAGYTGIYAEWDLDLDGDGTGDEPWDFGNSRQYPALRHGGLAVAGQGR